MTGIPLIIAFFIMIIVMIVDITKFQIHPFLSIMGVSLILALLALPLAKVPGTIGAGAMTVSHANDSYFWVVTNFGGMKAEDGYKTQTMCTLLMGIASIVFIWIISLFCH